MKPVLAADRVQLAQFKELVLRVCGFSLENEREATLRTALQERMSALNQVDFEAYFGILQNDPPEVGRLVELLTVNETYFLREPDHLKLIIQHLVPEILASREGPVRFLCAGCSSGEEPYSLAIMLRERYGDACDGMFSIAGVDIDPGMIALARRGVYGRHSFRGVDPDLVAKHFDSSNSAEFHIREPARRLVDLEVVNLLSPAFPPLMARPDIILYRNVSIYFPRNVQGQIFRRLADSLCENGYLIVGATETISHDVGVLALVQREGLFVFRKQSVLPVSDRREVRRPAAKAPSLPEHSRPPAIVRREGHPPSINPRPTSGKDVRRQFDDALELAHASQWQEALGLLDELLKLDASFIKAHTLRACVLMNGARHEEARQACERALELDAMCLEGVLMLGVIARHDGNDDLAHRRFREALYLESNCWLAHYYLAEIHFLKGDGKRARAGYESTLRILGDGGLLKAGRSLFPLSFRAESFIDICRHKLSLLKGKV